MEDQQNIHQESSKKELTDAEVLTSLKKRFAGIKNKTLKFLIGCNIVIFGSTILAYLYLSTYEYVGLAGLVFLFPFWSLVGIITIIDVIYYTYYLISSELTKHYSNVYTDKNDNHNVSHIRRVLFYFVLVTSVLILIILIYNVVAKLTVTKKINKETYTTEQVISAINSCHVRGIWNKAESSGAFVLLKNGVRQGFATNDFQKIIEAANNVSSKCGFIRIYDSNGRSNLVPEYVSEAQAIELLNTCKIKVFQYADNSSYSRFGTPEGSPSGILTYPKQLEPKSMKIEDEWISKLVPIAREAQKKCPTVQFSYGDVLEQRDSKGNWYNPKDAYQDNNGKWYSPYGKLIE